MARRPLLALLLVFVVAGCLGAPSGTQPAPTTATGTPEQPSTPTATPTSTTTATPPPTPPATTTPTTPGSPTANNTVDYAALSATQQRAFDRAVDGGVQFVDDSALDSPYVGDDYFARDAADPFQSYDYVRKNGTHYRVSYEESGGQGLATYGIRATERGPPDDASVVVLDNLSTEVREPVRWAIENGSYGVPAGKWYSLPQVFDRFEYVRVSDDTYRISVVYGDLIADALHVARTEGTTTPASDRDTRN
ncbi:hypothetical protein C2R22_17180 [Salinigranum rubrum]|uniref:DUF7979 domain-containing protein n=1 Tax=Salinigranum rubrum TaxID=755307 RepID=A0A2I8VMK1_9EURY|nr:hypothetical protein [Salinigranum rubrum]AUV83167.1 hypothetical protein C2R22_17180 [Salinigranum rubrum]